MFWDDVLKKTDIGYYYATVSTTVGDGSLTVQSSPALVFVNPTDPTFAPTEKGPKEQFLAGQTVLANEGENVLLKTLTVGNGLRYSWSRVDGKPLPETAKGAQTSELMLRGVTPQDAGDYVATLSFDDGLSSTVRIGDALPWQVLVRALPQITSQPLAEQVRSPDKGETAVFSAGMVVTNDTRFQWFYRSLPDAPWVPVPGATVGSGTGSSCVISNVKQADEGEYRLEVSNPAGTITSDIAKLTVRRPVVIESVLVDVPNADPGSSVIFSSLTNGGDLSDPAYQWMKQNPRNRVWVPLAGQISSTMTLSNLTEADEGLYMLRAFAQVNGVVDSAPVKLSVNDPVSFVAGQRLNSMTRREGESVVFNVKAAGYAPRFQWYRSADGATNWTAVTGATAASLTINSAKAENAGYYGVVLDNGFSKAGLTRAGAQDPDPAPLPLGRLVVLGLPVLETFQPSAADPGTSISNGVLLADEASAVTLTLRLSDLNSGPVSYQWRKNGEPIAGARAEISRFPEVARLQLTNLVEANTAQYDVVFTNAQGAIASEPLSLFVKLKPQVVVGPADQVVADSSGASFRVESKGWDLSYQWEWSASQGGNYASEPLADFESAGEVLSLSGVVADGSGALGGGYFRVRVSNIIGGVLRETVSAPARLWVTASDDIKITAQPLFAGLTSAIVAPGGTPATLSVTATGSGVLKYQWRKNGTAISGATASFLQLPAADNNSGGVYDVLVSNGANFAYSNPCTLVVDPRIDAISIPSTANIGAGVRLEVKASSLGGLTYQWRRHNLSGGSNVTNGGGVSGANSAALVFSDFQAADAGSYSVTVTSPNGSQTTAWASVSTVSKVSILTQPVGVSKAEGQRAQLSVVAQGGGSLSYKWLKDGVALTSSASASIASAGTSSVLTFGSIRSGDAGNYQVEVSNEGGALTSAAASVLVQAALSVSIGEPPVVKVGSALGLTASVQGADSVKYQWYRGTGAALSKLAGATASQLRLNPVMSSDAGAYTLEVIDSGNATRTARASVVLNVLSAPELSVSLASQSVKLGSPVVFAVSAKSSSPLVYQWFKGTTELAETSSRLRITSASASDFGSYKVRVSVSGDNTLFAEATAQLTEVSGAARSSVNNQGALGTLNAASPSRWWIYRVNATDRGTSADFSPRSGIWILERKEVKESGVLTSVSAGRAAWVWADADGAVVWGEDEQQVADGDSSAASVFSLIGLRGSAPLQSVVLGGEVDEKSVAGWFGAPDTILGTYEMDESLDIEMTWDEDLFTEMTGTESWDDLLMSIRSKVQSSSSSPSGALIGD